MTTGDGSPLESGRPTTVTKLPRRGTVLVRSSGPPEVPTGRRVEVRPGPFATFDGERFGTSLSVAGENGRVRFERDELPYVEDAVVGFLREGEPTIGEERESARTSGRAVAVVCFGDRAACQRRLPAATVETIERRLGVAASRAGAALLTWTTARPRPADSRAYDAVLDRPPTRWD